VDKDTVIVPFTEADTVQKYFPGAEVYTDLFFHGTHTGATVSSNAVRIAGITSGTKLVAVKVCGYINECPFSSILNGVIYAADNGADVINLSVGGAFAKAGNGRFVGLINKAFNYARSQGVPTVVSAGDGAAGARPTPPGGRDVCVWAACSQTVLADSLDKQGHPVKKIKPCAALPILIVGARGTSMAAPHVAGTAALLVSILGRNPSQIKARIQQSADNVAGHGTTPIYGTGRLNAPRAGGAVP